MYFRINRGRGMKMKMFLMKIPNYIGKLKIEKLRWKNKKYAVNNIVRSIPRFHPQSFTFKCRENKRNCKNFPFFIIVAVTGIPTATTTRQCHFTSHAESLFFGNYNHSQSVVITCWCWWLLFSDEFELKGCWFMLAWTYNEIVTRIKQRKWVKSEEKTASGLHSNWKEKISQRMLYPRDETIHHCSHRPYPVLIVRARMLLCPHTLPSSNMVQTGNTIRKENPRNAQHGNDEHKEKAFQFIIIGRSWWTEYLTDTRGRQEEHYALE